MLLAAERFRPARADWIQASISAALLFMLYALTAPRTVALEDDGLFVLSSYFLGVEHPPGYPLFTLIGHLFTHLPFGSVAYRVHLVSALFGALSGAAAWLCARALIPGRLPAYVAAFGLGLSPVYWSQSIIAEVYTLNSFFLLVLVFLGLRVAPPLAPPPAPAEQARLLSWMALIFGLSLSNHWPLMLLVAPAFAVLLWPVRDELLRRFGLLSWLVILGLLPYVWMVMRSWMAIPISFDGPLESIPEIWYFVARKGYAEIDQSVSAGWLDRIKFFEFLGGQLLAQFAFAVILAVGARSNLLSSSDWAARYAQTILRTLPKDAVVFAQGDADLAPMAYFQMIENWRPDITLYNAKGLVLGNRLFHPLRTSEKTGQRIVSDMVKQQTGPVVSTLDAFSGYAKRDRWIYIEVDKSSEDRQKVTVDIPQEAIRFFEESVARVDEPNPWVAGFQGELRRRYATLLAQSLPRAGPPDERSRRHLELLAKDFYGALGIAEGMILNKEGYSVGAVADALDRARQLMPSDASKGQLSLFFVVRGTVRADLKDTSGAIRDFETALSVSPSPDNAAISALEDLYRKTGDEKALADLQDRVKRLKPKLRE